MTESRSEQVLRVDAYPTHEVGGYRVRAGKPFPFGANVVPGGVSFSVFSDQATSMTLVLFRRGEPEPMAELEFPEEFRTGSVFAMTVFGLDHENIEYGYRADGPYDPVTGHRFDARQILSDPYARLIAGRDVWGVEPDRGRGYQYRSRVCLQDFDWADDTPLRIPAEDLVVYEAHVRGFTRHPSSGVTAPGTFAGLREKIPYLRELGVNCIELLPVFEFDESDNPRSNPETGEKLYDYWGYNTVSFFAPKAGYAATGRYGMQGDEFRTLIKDLHAAGIEVILDVVFNHTAEGNEQGPTISFKGLDNATYYMLTPEGYYFNFSGTGNTVNCNHPVVRNYVLDCLRHWVADYHIDGFRFDLAAILGRSADGTPLPNPPLLELLAYDPVLRHTKLIAEAWDAGGLYEVGNFPAYGRWAEWNGKYRDTVRSFLKGDPGVTGELATRIAGSPDLYSGRGTSASVNFLTAHDGFLARRPGLLQRQAQRGQRRGQQRRGQRQRQLELRRRGADRRPRDQRAARASDEERPRHPLHQPGHSDAAVGGRGRTQPAGQQQHVLPGQRTLLVRLGPGRRERRTASVHARDDRLPQASPRAARDRPPHRPHA
ncbi:glycogen debranching protein [Streptomyces sp. CA-243310]|uniref:glycogen debranching protein n=1 Tax=Streptomyces sp. CA-243310 TaxID=3240056 RepID=UPI003D8C4BF9